LKRELEQKVSDGSLSVDAFMRNKMRTKSWMKGDCSQWFKKQLVASLLSANISETEHLSAFEEMQHVVSKS